MNNEPVPQLFDDGQDFESSEISIPISLVEKIAELLITLKEEDEEERNSPLIDQIELIISTFSSVEKESKTRTPRLFNRRTNRPRRRHRKSRRKDIV